MIRQDLKAAMTRKRQVEATVKSVLDAQARPYASATIRGALGSKLAEFDRELALADQQIQDLEAKLRPFADLTRTRAALKGRVERFRERARRGDLTIEQKREVPEYLGIRVLAAAGGACKVEASISVESDGNAEDTPCR